jgi:dipeptidyl aminopeptidase/acylaminoacyl peptidase
VTAGQARPSRRKAVIWLGLGVAAVAIGAAALVALRSYRTEAGVFVPRHWSVPKPSAGFPGLAEVSFQAGAGERIAGWYLPGANRAAVILLHGSGADRSSMLAEAEVLHGAGFGVLLYDSPGHGESSGEIHWHEPERRALRAAVDFLARRPDVDAARIGALGFSMGAYLLAMYAADDARLRAVVIGGTPTGARVHLAWEYRRFGWLSQWPATWAVARAGMPLDDPTPIGSVGRIAPRPLLIVTGSDDQHVPPSMADELLAAAGAPKQLAVIAGAGHGGYRDAPGSHYAATVTAFFTEHLAALP